MAGTLAGALVVDSRRRREKAEQKAADTPREQILARNACIMALAQLPPQAALAVLKGVERSLLEYLATLARAGL